MLQLKLEAGLKTTGETKARLPRNHHGCCVLHTERRKEESGGDWRDETCDDGSEVAGVDADGDLLGGGRGAEARRPPAPPGPAPEPHRRRHYLPRMPAEIRHRLLKHRPCPSPQRAR